MKDTLKKIFKYTFLVIGVYALHILIEALVVTNALAYLGYHLPVFIV